MANYYLKNSDVTKMYRLQYRAVGEAPTIYHIEGAFFSGANVMFPDGTSGTGLDIPVELRHVLIDIILGNVSAGTVAEYRTLAKARIDASW